MRAGTARRGAKDLAAVLQGSHARRWQALDPVQHPREGHPRDETERAAY
jgi:hypothetical protein